MSDGIGHSRSASAGVLWRNAIEVRFNQTNYDKKPLSFGDHFSEICAHNTGIDLITAFKEATKGSDEHAVLLEQLSKHKQYIKSLIETAVMRVDGRIERNAETEVSDKTRLKDLCELLNSIDKVAPPLEESPKLTGEDQA